MVSVENLPSVPGGVSADGEGVGEPERQLGRISCTTDDGRITLWTDMLALHDGRIQVASIMGAESAAKAIAAILHSDGKAAFRIDAEGVPYYQEFDKEKDGYSVYKHRASLNHWHFVAISKKKGLLTCMDEAALWQELRSERFSTPLLRAWAPYMVEQLKERGLLEPLEGFGCEAGMLTADSNDLDQIVTEGLFNRQIVIE